VLEALMDFCKLEMPARMEGKRMVALLAPKPGGTKPAAAAKPAAPKAAPSGNGPAPPKSAATPAPSKPAS
jgi:translation initiation factor IF-3